ncbi:hypothetical protein JCM17092_14400 [Haloplanus litoreus]
MSTAEFVANSTKLRPRYFIFMVNCARCGRDVDDLQRISPDVISKELIDSIDHGEEDLAGEDDLKVCAECMAELKGE